MKPIDQVRRLWEHAFWADAELQRALRAAADAAPEALREYAHVVGAEEVWLARLQTRPSRSAVWPDASFAEVRSLSAQTHDGYRAFLADLRDDDLDTRVTYTNSAGRTFENSVGDVLLHVVLHGQYHRGKVNLLLRQAGCEPAPTDYIAFIRGAPAATRADRHGSP